MQHIQEKKINIAVSAFIMKNEKFILLKRANPPMRWCPPGGRVREGESFIEAAIRESREEAGADIRVLMPISYWFGKHSGEVLSSIGFLCEYISGELRFSKEHVESGWFSIEEMRDKKLSHDIGDFIRAKEIKNFLTTKKIK